MAEEKRTQFAMAQIDFAGLFATYIQDKAPKGCALALTAPEGPSTGGGVQSVQHITLTMGGGKALVIGSCSTVEKAAELRDFDYFSNLYQQRYGAAPAMARADYDKLLKSLKDFFSSQTMPSKVVATPAAASARPEPPRKSSTGLIIFIVLLLAVLAGGLVYYFFFMKA